MGARVRLPRLLGGLLALYLLVPFAMLLHALWGQWIANPGQAGAFDGFGIGRPLLVSLVTAVMTTGLLALLGVPLGYALARGRGRWNDLLGLMVQLPLAVPPLVAGMLLLLLFGPYAPLPITDTLLGIVAAQTFVASPYVVVGARAAFSAVDPGLEGVAATLGTPDRALLPRVALPAAWPAVRASLMLAFLRAFGEFGATLVVAYHPYSLPVATWVAFSGGGVPPAYAMAALATGIAAAVLVAATRAGTPRARPRPAREAVGTAPGRPVPDVRGWLDRSPPPGSAPAAAGTPPGMRLASIEVPQGTFRLRVDASTQARRVAVLGPSGGGKSLMLKLLAGLHTPSGGTLTVGGERWAGSGGAFVPPQARRVGYQPQDYGLFPQMTVRQQVAFGLRGVGQAQREAAVDRWLARLGLAELGHRYPAELSGGQRQRVALGRALAPAPRLLLLDEPFSALDTFVRVALRQELRALQDETGVPSVLVTHDPAEAAELADEVWVLVGGALAQRGRPADLRRHPATAAVAGILGGGTVLTARPAADGWLAWGRWRLAPDPWSGQRHEVEVYLPDDALVVLAPGERAPAGCSVAPGVVRQAVAAAGGWSFRVGVAGAEAVLAVAAGPRPVVAPEPGTPCRLALDPADVHVFDAPRGALLART